MATATKRKTYVKFTSVASRSGHDGATVWTLRDDLLGYIEWYPRWRQYVFQPGWDAEFSSDCLEDIAAQVKTMNDGARA